MSRLDLSTVSAHENGVPPLDELARTLRVRSISLMCVTTRPLEIVDVTTHVTEAIRKSGIDDGLAHVQSMHTTTALFLNECQQALLHDFQTLFEEVVEGRNGWRHNDPRYSDCTRGNAAAHLRSVLLGNSILLQVRDGKPVLGRWQAVLFAELDGPQSRSLSVQVMGI
jgi:secondary thiamine-phosphate synthase enzyme